MKASINFLIFFFPLFLLAESYWASDFLTYEQAKKKWGETTFDAKKFKILTEKEKGAMAVNALKINAFVGKERKLIRSEMGTPDSYFFSDTIYAYEITPPGENKESWQLLFIPDEKLEKVKEVKINKKCCYKYSL